jgi:predicted DCC family thiol-disulfide oxidoreductase YuxK
MSPLTLPVSDPETLWLVYDGDCPLCRASALGVRIKKAAGQLMTLDARTAGEHELMAAIAAEGLDLNQGIVVRYHGLLHHGIDALHLLALLSSPHDSFNRFNAWMFKSKARVKALYPLMKAVRRLSLGILGKDLI